MLKFSHEEILETVEMIEALHLDIRTVTMGISLIDCIHPDPKIMGEKIFKKIKKFASSFVKEKKNIEEKYGIPIVNTRISVTPIGSIMINPKEDDFLYIANILDEVAEAISVDFLGGFSALVHKGATLGERLMISSIPDVLSSTKRVCSSVNVASTKAGINMDAVSLMGNIIKETAKLTSSQNGIGCAKLVVFANAVEDNPFMAGAFHGFGEPECCINVGVSGPGVVLNALEKLGEASLGEVAEAIKKAAFKITRVGELVGRELSRRLNVEFGILDLSLAPTPEIGDSVANIIEKIGIELAGAPGSTAALALLTDAVKKGGSFASSYVGGLSGAFIPVSEDWGMIRAARVGSISIDKLEAMTSVCSVGLDMIAVPGDTPASTISAIIADEAAIGIMNNKTTGVRIIPAPNKKVGEMVEFGGLLGKAPVMQVSKFSSDVFIKRGGRIPAPISSLTN
ncbi:MAG: PFL family protein [Deltaproteobacteria bacterium]|nr:MAG: PFL family protein [Deltaproteobacteria bacterium]